MPFSVSGITVTTNRYLTGILTGIVLGISAGLLGLLTVLGGPLISFGAAIGIGVGLYVLTNLMAGLYLTLAAVALLPFATLPVRVALTPTFIDLAIGGFLLVYLFQWMTRKRPRFRFIPVQLLILVFAAFLIFSFVAGLGNAPPTTSTLRKFAEMVLSIGLAIVLIDVIRDSAMLRRIALVLILLGALQGVIGTALYAINESTANRLLNTLNRFGYPSGDVLRYVEDNPDLGERAIGTWVDPNAYGGFLLMVGALAGVQILAARPVTGNRWVAALLFAPIVLALYLTNSRGAAVGLGTAVLFVALLRYRWLLFVIALAAGVMLTLPFMQSYINRFLDGVGGRDLATQMRFGEYKDALILIGRYPLLGVGFTGAPDRDIYLGVSSTYLKIAGATGLLGLAVFLLLIVEVYRFGLRRWSRLRVTPEVGDLWLGFAAGLVGALVSGVVDHYYFNIEFHGAVTMFWLFIGLSLTAARLADPDTKAEAGVTRPLHVDSEFSSFS